MTFENLIRAVISVNPYLVVKLFFIVGLLMYVVFAYVVVRQVQLMSDVLEGHGQQGIKIITLVHMVVVALLFLLALIIL